VSPVPALGSSVELTPLAAPLVLPCDAPRRCRRSCPPRWSLIPREEVPSSAPTRTTSSRPASAGRRARARRRGGAGSVAPWVGSYSWEGEGRQQDQLLLGQGLCGRRGGGGGGVIGASGGSLTFCGRGSFTGAAAATSAARRVSRRSCISSSPSRTAASKSVMRSSAAEVGAAGLEGVVGVAERFPAAVATTASTGGRVEL
jgi:hypothetical protein